MSLWSLFYLLLTSKAISFLRNGIVDVANGVTRSMCAKYDRDVDGHAVNVQRA